MMALLWVLARCAIKAEGERSRSRGSEVGLEKVNVFGIVSQVHGG